MKGPAAARHRRVDSFNAWTRQGGKFRPVPVQVEEVNASGDYVLAGGLPYTKNTGTGFTDARSEIVVDGGDLGDDFERADVPEGLTARGAVLWKVAFCRGGKRAGWLLVRSTRAGHGPAPAAAGAEVTFDQKAGTIRTPLYSYRFAPANPVLLGEVRVVRQDGRERPVIRDSKFLMPLRTPFWLPNLTLEDKDFTSTIESWQSGPLRTIVAVGVRYTSFLSLFKLHLFSELVFYKNRFVIPTQVQFVFDPATYLSPGSGLAYALRFPPGEPWRVTSNLAPLPRVSPKEALEQTRKATDTDVFKAEAHGPGGSFLVEVQVDPKARRDVPTPFILEPRDFTAPAATGAWPWLEQMAGSDLGVFLDVSRIHQGTYDFGLDLLLSPKADDNFTDYGTVDTEWQSLPMHG